MALIQLSQDDELSTGTLEAVTGLSRKSLAAHERGGRINKTGRGRWNACQTISSLIEYYEEVAAGRRSETGDLCLIQERAKLARAQEENCSLKNAQLKGDLLPRGAVDAAVIASFANVRAKMLALPGKLAPFAATTDSIAEIQDHFRDGVHEALAELASPETIVAVAKGL